MNASQNRTPPPPAVLESNTAPGDDAEADAADVTVFLVASREGAVIHASPDARAQLRDAAAQNAGVGHLDDAERETVLLLKLVAAVADALAGNGREPALLDLGATSDRFLIRAYPLDLNDAGVFSVVGIHVERRLPLRMKMLRSPAFATLTRREKDIAQMLTTGMPYPRIGQQLGMKQSTVVTHVRALAKKLGAGSRDEIVSKLSG